MADVNANINIDINSSGALSELKRLEGQINSFQRNVSTSNAAAAARQASINRALLDGINATGLFTAKQVDAVSSTARFTNALEKNKLSLGEYTRYAASQLPGMSRIFQKEFATMERVATERVRAINTQYVALGKSVDGITRSIAATPDALRRGYGTEMAVAIQRQQMFNKLIDDGSTKLLNWGKNTQWAGRQLMVGLSLPMAAFGAAAAAAFMELDKATVQLKRVYGDLSTTTTEVNANAEAIKTLGAEYTKYGIAVADTIALGARAAATGATNETLLAATEQTLRFATLGQIDYNQALDTTISLQTAFAISNDQLANKIDFLNAVENQTILTIEDMSLAIPRVATVVKGLGGDVEDLAVMMTAMREGGVSAENAANGLKSGLASMINPTNAATEALRGMGINLEGIVSQYRGDLMGTIMAFGTELDKLSSFERQQALEKVFGKYQYARMSALFDNITSKTGQAARAMDLAGMSAEELASIAEKELGTIAESTTVKFKASLEQLKLSIAPIGEAFLKMATPVIDVVSKIANAFNSLPEPIKNAIGLATVAIAGIGPVLLMGIGLMGNLVANIVKGIQWWRKLGARIKGDASAFDYMAKAELDALAATEALEGSTHNLTGKLQLQAGAVRALTAEYQRFAGAAGIAGGAMAAMPARGGRGRGPLKMAKGGIVPGSGSGDKIPTLLEPGETIVTKQASQKYGPVLAAMNAGTLPGYAKGNTSGRGTEFAHIGMPIETTINELIAVVDKLPGSISQGMERFIRGIGGTLGGDIPAFAYGGLGFETGKTSGGKSINNLMKDVGVELSEFMTDWDSRGIERWSESVRLAGLKMNDVGPELSQLDDHVRKYLLSLDKATMVTDSIMQDAYKYAATQLGPNSVVAKSFGELEKTAREVRVNVTEQQAVSRGAAVTQGQRGGKFINIGLRGFRLGGDRTKAKRIPGIPMSEIGTQTATTAGQTTGRAQLLAAQRVLGINSPAKEGENLSTSIAQGQLIGAKRSSGVSAEAGRIIAQSQIKGMTKEAYKAQQSASRREAYNIKRMQEIGMTDTQILRQLERLEAAKKRQLIAAQKSAAVAEQSAATQSKIAVAEAANNASKNSSLAGTRMGKFAGGAGKAGMALGMASMIPFMAQNEEGKFMGMNANALGMGMMGGGMALEFASMAGGSGLFASGGALAGFGGALATAAIPLAAITVAATAAGVALYVWRDNVDNAARKAAELGANLGGTANAANKMAQLLGKQTPAQREQARLAGLTTEQQEQAKSEFQGIFESEAGKKFIQDLQAATSSQRFTMLGDYLKSAIATGLMDKQQAELFGKSVALQIDDPILGVRIGQAIKDQVAGLEGMLDIAEKRSAAIGKDGAMSAVGAGTATSDQAAQVLGSSIQAIQDWSNVAAIAKQEYQDGVISYDEMIDAVNRAKDAQLSYAKSIEDALSQGDSGGNMQAVKQQLVNSGAMTEEGFDELMGSLESTKTKGPSVTTTTKGGAIPSRVGAIPLNEEDTNQLKSLVITMIAQGVNPAEAEKLGKDIFSDPKIKKKYQGLIEELGTSAAAQVAASDVGRVNVAEIAKAESAKASDKGIFGKIIEAAPEVKQAIENNMIVDELKVDYAKVNGDIRELEAYLAQYSDEELLTIIPRLKEIPVEDQQKFFADNVKMQESINRELVDKIQGQADYSGNEAEAVQEATKALQGEDLEKVISVILNKQPANLDEVLPELTDKILDIKDKVPDDVQKMLNIDFTNVDQILSLTEEDINNLKFMGEAISNLPEERKEMAADIAYKVNGKPKDPKTFLTDLQKQTTAFEKLKSKKTEVKKKAMFDLITLRDGKPADPEQIDQAVKDLEEKFGPGIVKNLPPDQFYKAVTATYDASQLRKQADSLDKAADSLTGVDKQFGARMRSQAESLRQAAADLESEAASAVAAGAGSATQSAAKDSGGGGGGDKADPFKDFKQGILNQIKQYADAEAKLKELGKAKYSFYNILKGTQGIDDKIRKAELNPILADQLMNMDPEEANKILKKITGKNGRLTKEGRQLQNQQIAGSIAETYRTARMSREEAGRQTRVTTDLTARGASAEAISEITGDSKKMLEYVTLLDKAASGSKKAQKELKNYANTLAETTLRQQAANSVAEKAIEIAESRRITDFTKNARAAGMDQGLIEYVASDAGLMAQYTEAVGKGQKAVDQFFASVKKQMAELEQEVYATNPLDYIAEQANEAMDAIRAQFAPEQLRLEDESAAKFESQYGMSKDAAQDLIDKNNVLISQYDQQVNEYERMNAQEQRLIQGHEREKKQWQDKIDSAQNYIDDWQHSIDLLNKQVSERNHQADLLNHELDLIGKAEQTINETYDKRTKALDQVEAVNNRILESQRSQLDISKALSTGDVYAAAAAAQQMKEQQVQQASTDARDALTAARDAQVAGLKSSGGMSREQIEEQLWQINQQNYQTSLQIYDLEDKIWQKNQEIYGYKQQIESIDNLIKEHTDKIWSNSGEILRIQNDLIAPLQDANGKWTDRLRTSDTQLAYDKDHLMYQGKTLEQYEKANERMNAHLKQLDGARILAEGMYDTWVGIGEAIAAANRTAKENLSYAAKGEFKKITGIDYTKFMAEDGTFDFAAFEAEVNALRTSQINGAVESGEAAIASQGGGQSGMMSFARGGVVGTGNRDSVGAMLTPGEYVVRKSMVNKYGQAMFEKINQGSFSLPRYNVEQSGANIKPTSVSNMSSPVYNNSYSINVPVNQPNASADEIAYKVMTKIKSIESSSIRRVNGY